MITAKTTALAALVLGLAGTALADTASGPRLDPAALDLDRDGFVTASEISRHRAARFSAVDTDGDGTLAPEELAAAMARGGRERAAQRSDVLVSRFDTDGDGALDLEEMPGRRLDEAFRRLDTDGDGAVAVEAFTDLRKPDMRGGGWRFRN